jgi:hypothetical protein
MGIMKTLLSAFIVCGLSSSAAWSDERFLSRVTECVGRLSAEIEHQWLLTDDSSDTSDRIETVRSDFLDILQTLVTPDTASKAMSGRIDAKVAHAALLSQATFSLNARQSAWALRRAKSELDACRDMLLSTAASAKTASHRTNESAKNQVNQETWRASR